MERLSDFAADIINDLHENSDWYGDYSLIEAAINRLASYEETGLEPEEISKIREDVENGYMKSTARRYGISVDRLRELAQADREGRCVAFQPGYTVVSIYNPADEDGLYTMSATGVITKEEYEAVLRREQDGNRI